MIGSWDAPGLASMVDLRNTAGAYLTVPTKISVALSPFTPIRLHLHLHLHLLSFISHHIHHTLHHHPSKTLYCPLALHSEQKEPLPAMASTSSVIELTNIPPSPTGSDPENPRTVIDPFSLSSSIKSEEEISTLTERHRHNASRWPYSDGRLLGRGAVTIADPLAPKVPKVKQKIDIRGIKEFYQNQNESIQLLLKPVEDHVREAKEEQGDTRVRYVYVGAWGP